MVGIFLLERNLMVRFTLLVVLLHYMLLLRQLNLAFNTLTRMYVFNVSKFSFVFLRTKRTNYHCLRLFDIPNALRVAACALLINALCLVRGCFFFIFSSCFDNSRLYLLRLRRFGLGSGTSASDGEVMSDMSPPFAERTRAMSASYSSIVIVTVAKFILSW